MQSLHPRYPVLKVPAPARLAAAVAQGLMMPETGATGGGNIGLHILNTFQSPQHPSLSCNRPEGSGARPIDSLASSPFTRPSQEEGSHKGVLSQMNRERRCPAELDLVAAAWRRLFAGLLQRFFV